MTSPLDRISSILANNSDEDHIELMEINARLLPLLREWADAEEAAAHEIDQRHPEAALLAVLDMKAALKRGSLLAALRGAP